MEEREIRPADLDLSAYDYASLLDLIVQDDRAILVTVPLSFSPNERTFERLTFEDATPFLAEGAPAPFDREAWEEFQRTGRLPRRPRLPRRSRARELLYVDIRSAGRPWSPSGPPWRLTLAINGLPPIELDFSGLRLARRHSVSRGRDGPICDEDTGEPFSIDDPFPG